MTPSPRRSSFPGLGEVSGRRRELIDELVRVRQEGDLSQTEIAARMGTSQSAVARLESGALDARLSTLERYAAALGRTVDWQIRPSGTYPPLPPSPPDPPFPRHTPWLPEPRPTAPGAVSASASMVVGDRDWLGERLLDQRVVALAGDLDDDAVNRAIAALALLDATGDDPVGLRLSGVSAGLDAVLPIVDALDLMGAPVHATALGRLTGPAVALLAVAGHRVAGAHAVFHLCEPRSPHGIPGRDVEARAAEHAARLRSFTERLAEACRRPVGEVAADMRAGRLLDAAQARDYGLVDATEPGRNR